MQTLVDITDVAALRGRWLRLRYSQSFRGQPVRPLLRLDRRDAPAEKHILPAAGFGRARWIGWAPRDLVRLELMAGDLDPAEFRLDAIEAHGAVPLLVAGLRRHPSGLVDLALWPFKPIAKRRLSLQRLLDLEPLDRVAAFAADRTRPLEPEGLDRGLASAQETLVEFVVPAGALPSPLRGGVGGGGRGGGTAKVDPDGPPPRSSAPLRLGPPRRGEGGRRGEGPRDDGSETHALHDRRLVETLRSLAGSAAITGWRLRIGVADPKARETIRSLAADFGLGPRVVVEVNENGDALALAQRATTPFVGLLQPGDRVTPEAVPVLIDALARRPDVAILYADSIVLDAGGHPTAPELKPDWSPEFFRRTNYVGRPSLIRTDLLREAAVRVPPGEPDPWWRFLQIVGEGAAAASVHHVRRPLLLRAWPETQPRHPEEAGEAGRLEGRRTVSATVPSPSPPASIIIPTRNRVDLLRRAVESLRALTAAGSFELIIVDNGSDDPDALHYLSALPETPDTRVVAEPGPFNFSRLVNRGVAEARHPVVVLLNNDCEILVGTWLARLSALAAQPGIGAVGARLLYADDTLQHAGIGIGLGGWAGHRDRGEPRDHPGHLGRLRVPHEVSAVTAACLAVKRDRYDEVGGFDEAFAIAFNDVDFCLRLGAAGYRNLLAPGAVLRHAESASRGRDAGGAKRARFLEEAALFASRWRGTIQSDPYTHPLFAIDRFTDRLG